MKSFPIDNQGVCAFWLMLRSGTNGGLHWFLRNFVPVDGCRPKDPFLEYLTANWSDK